MCKAWVAAGRNFQIRYNVERSVGVFDHKYKILWTSNVLQWHRWNVRWNTHIILYFSLFRYISAATVIGYW